MDNFPSCCLLCSHWLGHLALNVISQIYQRLSFSRRLVIFKMPVGHLTKYLVGHHKSVILKTSRRKQWQTKLANLSLGDWIDLKFKIELIYYQIGLNWIFDTIISGFLLVMTNFIKSALDPFKMDKNPSKMDQNPSKIIKLYQK